MTRLSTLKLNLDYLPKVKDEEVQRNFISIPAKDVEVLNKHKFY